MKANSSTAQSTLIQPRRLVAHSQDDVWQRIEITEELAQLYSLDEWSQGFSLMTAGYRDQLDPDDAANPEVAFNVLTVMILGEAKARVFKRKLAEGQVGHVHIGGETRPHTQEFISILSRIYAAHEMQVHLRARCLTTPIWYSSFGVFYSEFQSGENLTASHSPFFKGGWKPLDSSGKQLLAEEQEIISEVQNIVTSRATIYLAPWQSSGSILYDFDVDEPYVRYQRSLIPDQSIAEIQRAAKDGFRCAICPVGGSMKITSERLFQLLGISTGKGGAIQYFFGEEDSHYHELGQIDEVNYGPDPGKWQVYRHIGAQEILIHKEANIVFIWDPDGDRLNMVTVAPASGATRFVELGLEVEACPGSDKCIVYFTPNQIFFMLTAYRLGLLQSDDLLDAYDWFVACSISTTRSIAELASSAKIPVAYVRVGFKHLGTFSEWLENREDVNEPYISVTGDRMFLGKKPRALVMCEESGGASFGGTELLTNKSGSRNLISLREKDGMQLALMTLSLAAYLHNSTQSFADYYCNMIREHNIRHRHADRYDLRLYDESLTGEEREIAKSAGMIRRDKVMEFFRGLAQQASTARSLCDIRDEMNARLADGDKPLPCPQQICFIGDGTYLEFDSLWFLIRASGTDAVLRYYIEGQDKGEMDALQRSFLNMQI